jgi:hypothetical protein
MKKILLFLFVLTSYLGFGQNNSQDKAENIVKKHLTSVFGDTYKSYGFETLYKISPPRITQVEDLKYKIDVLRKNNLLTDSSLKYYDSIIKMKIDTIRLNKEFSSYELSHYYVVKDGDKNFLYYTQFILTPDGKIKDLNKKMSYEFVGKEYDWFYSYYRRNPMLPNDLKENEKCFEYLNNLLKTNENKEATMATVIHTYSVISRKGFLDTIELPKLLAINWLRLNNIEEFVIARFSTVKSIIDEGEKIGYNLFVEYEKDNKKQVRYFEYDMNFILTGSLPVDMPFEPYFTKP